MTEVARKMTSEDAAGTASWNSAAKRPTRCHRLLEKLCDGEPRPARSRGDLADLGAPSSKGGDPAGTARRWSGETPGPPPAAARETSALARQGEGAVN